MDDIQHSAVLRAILTLVKVAIIAISIVMVCVTLAQVIFRYVIAAPLPWSEELARYCFVWIVFLGGALGLARGIHLGVDLLVNAFPPGMRRAFLPWAAANKPLLQTYPARHTPDPSTRRPTWQGNR